MIMRERNPWIDVALLIGTSAAFGACTQEIESDPATTALNAGRISLATTTTVARAESSFRTHLYSELDADVIARINTDEISGPGLLVKGIHVEIGDRVKAGQLLATLEDDEAKLQVEATAAAADEAKANFERIEELHQREVVSPSEYETALSKKRRAEAAFKRARLDLSRTRVRAPFSGVVARRYIQVGQLVEDGAPLFRVTAVAPLRARLLVPEGQAAFFRPKAPVRLNGVGGESATAQVLLVGPTVDPASGTREVIVELSEADAFRPGASVSVELVSVEEGTDR